MAMKDITDVEVLQAIDDYKQGGFPHFTDAVDLLSNRAGECYKVCYRCFERVHDRGLIEYGVSLRCGWLTDKGRIELKEYRQYLDKLPQHTVSVTAECVVTFEFSLTNEQLPCGNLICKGMQVVLWGETVGHVRAINVDENHYTLYIKPTHHVGFCQQLINSCDEIKSVNIKDKCLVVNMG